MPGGSSPWISRPALWGGGFGVAVAAGLALAPRGLGVARAVLLLLPPVLGYLAGWAVAAATRARDQRDDLTRLREEIRACQDHIMETGSFRSLAAYLDGASDGLKGPVAALGAEARALAADPSLGGEVKAAAERVLAHAERLRGTVEPLARYALPQPARAPFDLNGLLREALDLCRRRGEEKRIRFEERYATLPPVFGPAARLRGALLNLVVNAIEAMPWSGGTIVVETSHRDGLVTARLRDTGIGIRPEHLGRAFDPFFTTKPERAGAGLGLWEARDVIERLGGSITLTSAPHQGTEVEIRLPPAAPLSPGREGTTHPQEIPRNTADEGQPQLA